MRSPSRVPMTRSTHAGHEPMSKSSETGASLWSSVSRPEPAASRCRRRARRTSTCRWPAAAVEQQRKRSLLTAPSSPADRRPAHRGARHRPSCCSRPAACRRLRCRAGRGRRPAASLVNRVSSPGHRPGRPACRSSW
jgi:hypothetical protein